MPPETTEPSTLADRVRALEAAYGGTFERTPSADAVTVRLVRATGEVLAATGPTTHDAFDALERRVSAFLTALGEV